MIVEQVFVELLVGEGWEVVGQGGGRRLNRGQTQVLALRPERRRKVCGVLETADRIRSFFFFLSWVPDLSGVW